MKIKKKILIGAIIVICAVLAVGIWSIKTKSLKYAGENSTKVSTNKDIGKTGKSGLQNNTSSQPNNKKSLQPKDKTSNEIKTEPKSSIETKSDETLNSQVKYQTQSKTVDTKDSKAQKVSNHDSVPKVQTFEGYITSEDDFAAGLKEDTADMIYMRLMALSGIGITFQQDGKWVFYYFDGRFSTDNKKGSDGKWTFDGTGSQLSAWHLVEQKVKSGNGKSPVPIKVTGVLNENTKTNLGPDADGRKFSVITVKSIIEK